MNKDRKEELDALLKNLEDGVTKIFETDFVKYLDFISKFHNYSFGNAILIMNQKPDASLCAGYKTWEKMGRHVNKGEKGIKIIAPMKVKKEVEKDVIDDLTNKVKMDNNGNPVKEVEIVKIQSYQVVNVFDVSQTSGAEIPLLGVKELAGDVEGYERFVKAITEMLDVPVEYENIESGAKGYYSPIEKRIVINEGMSELQSLKTLVHESMHRYLHDKDGCLIEGIDESDPSRNQKETEAEAGAYVVLKHYGIDTSDYSFSYVCGWSSGKDMSILKDSLNTISVASNWMINGIDDQMEIIQKREQNGGMNM